MTSTTGVCVSDIGNNYCWFKRVANLAGPDDPEVFDGMPVGLQAVGRRCDDEKVVAVMELLQKYGCLLE